MVEDEDAVRCAQPESGKDKRRRKASYTRRVGSSIDHFQIASSVSKSRQHELNDRERRRCRDLATARPSYKKKAPAKHVEGAESAIVAGAPLIRPGSVSLSRCVPLGRLHDGPRHSSRGHEETWVRSALLRLPDLTRRGVRGTVVAHGLLKTFTYLNYSKLPHLTLRFTTDVVAHQGMHAGRFPR